jgi:hypothetical protein
MDGFTQQLGPVHGKAVSISDTLYSTLPHELFLSLCRKGAEVIVYRVEQLWWHAFSITGRRK